MRRFCIFPIIIGVLLLLIGCVKTPKERITKKTEDINIEQILGMWEVKSGTDAEQYEFQRNGKELLFFSYNNTKPGDSGTFQLNNGTLTIKDNASKKEYKIVFANNTLKLIDKNKNEILLVRENKKPSENKILLNNFNSILGEAESLSGIESGEPKPVNIQWKIDEKKTTSINGYLSICNLSDKNPDFSKVNEAVSSICDYLEGLGYKKSEINSSEFQEGYSDGTYIITVTTSNDNFNIKISIGVLENK